MALIPASGRREERREIITALEAFFEALRTRSASALERAVTDDFTLYEDGEIWDAARTFSVISTPPHWERQWVLGHPQVEISGDIAAVIYRNRLRAQHGGRTRQREWLENALLRRDSEGDWRVQFLHSASIAPLRSD